MMRRRKLFVGLASSPALLLPSKAEALPPMPDMVPVPLNLSPGEWARRVNEQVRVSMAWMREHWENRR